MVESRRDDNKEKSGLATRQNSNTSAVVSDRRARRKLKRGEEVIRATDEDDAAEIDDDYEDDDYDEDDEVADASASGRGVTAGKGVRTRKRDEALRDREREAQGRAENVPVVGGLITYFRGVVAEVQKVTWPTREEAQRLTILVLAVTVSASLVLGAIDLFYGWWMQEGIKSTGTFVLVAIPVAIIAGGLSWFYVIREQE